MKPSVIVWDLETIPDLSGFAAANDLVGKSDVEIREATGDKFPRSSRVKFKRLRQVDFCSVNAPLTAAASSF
jgi:hypothetical protein